jgi:hypothetical protein
MIFEVLFKAELKKQTNFIYIKVKFKKYINVCMFLVKIQTNFENTWKIFSGLLHNFLQNQEYRINGYKHV